MNHTGRLRFAFAVFALGCGGPPSPAPTSPKEPSPATTNAVGKQAPMGPNVILEVLPNGQRRVLVNAQVCFRRGVLEMLLCRKNTKEHESVLSGDFDARDIHKALLAAGAEPGSPATFQPTYSPASGTPIKVFVRYQKDGREETVDARQWIRDARTLKPLTIDWVFAGSFFFPDQDDPNKKRYAANLGDVICVSNFRSAMLDLPIESSAANDDLRYDAFTENIPEIGTKVTLILEPQIKLATDEHR